MYQQLDDARIIDTLERLRDRIGERFPGSGLSSVSRELVTLARQASEHVAYLARPNWPVRIAVGAAIVVMFAIFGAALLTVRVSGTIEGWGDLLQSIEAAINDVVLVGIAIYFLMSVERRIKRRRALYALHQLRSIAHIVDMHQLTKDPERLISPQPDTQSSPARTMTRGELGRYLDYCSELLSITSKIGALFVQRFDDPVVLAAVDEIEMLTSALSNKVWQKITLLDRVSASPAS